MKNIVCENVQNFSSWCQGSQEIAKNKVAKVFSETLYISSNEKIHIWFLVEQEIPRKTAAMEEEELDISDWLHFLGGKSNLLASNISLCSLSSVGYFLWM